MVINYLFDRAYGFNEKGYAVVYTDDKGGVINTKGSYLIPPKYEHIWPDGNWFVFEKNNIQGWCDKRGRTVIAPQFEAEWMQFFNGSKLAPMQAKSGYGYIDRKGKWRVPPQFDLAYSFSGRIAFVKNGRWGAINSKGEMAIAFQFDDIHPVGGLWCVKSERIDINDLFDISKFQPYAHTFGAMIARYNHEEEGIEVIEPSYPYLTSVRNDGWEWSIDAFVSPYRNDLSPWEQDYYRRFYTTHEYEDEIFPDDEMTIDNYRFKLELEDNSIGFQYKLLQSILIPDDFRYKGFIREDGNERKFYCSDDTELIVSNEMGSIVIFVSALESEAAVEKRIADAVKKYAKGLPAGE